MLAYHTSPYLGNHILVSAVGRHRWPGHCASGARLRVGSWVCWTMMLRWPCRLFVVTLAGDGAPMISRLKTYLWPQWITRSWQSCFPNHAQCSRWCKQLHGGVGLVEDVLSLGQLADLAWERSVRQPGDGPSGCIVDKPRSRGSGRSWSSPPVSP